MLWSMAKLRHCPPSGEMAACLQVHCNVLYFAVYGNVCLCVCVHV
jgi:hypothetical protein